jgi:hypothetical protein
VAGAFRAAYAAARARSARLAPANPWRFAAGAVLGDFDAFLARLRELQHVAQTALLFQRLERVEIGGSRVRGPPAARFAGSARARRVRCAYARPAPRAQGRALTTSVRGIHAAFAAAYARVQAAAGDPLDLPASAYAAEAAAFNAAILDLERRLAAVLCQARRRACNATRGARSFKNECPTRGGPAAQAFDDCTTAAAVFKLLEGFEGLLDRGAVAADLERKALSLLRSLAADLRKVRAARAPLRPLRARPPPGHRAPRAGGRAVPRAAHAAHLGAQRRALLRRGQLVPRAARAHIGCARAAAARRSRRGGWARGAQRVRARARPDGARARHAARGGGERGGMRGGRAVRPRARPPGRARGRDRGRLDAPAAGDVRPEAEAAAADVRPRTPACSGVRGGPHVAASPGAEKRASAYPSHSGVCIQLALRPCEARGARARRVAEADGRVELAVNFDPALTALLREVRYFLLLDDLPSPIPAAALKARGHPRRPPRARPWEPRSGVTRGGRP